MSDVQGLTPLAEGGHGAVLRVHRNGGGDALVVKVVPVDDRLALKYELQCLTYVHQAGIHSAAPALLDVVSTDTCACMVMGYVEGHETGTVGDAALVGRELVRLHALPLPVFAAQGSFMGLPLSAQGIVPTEMKTLLPCDPWEMADQLASENLATGLTHGHFMPGNILTAHSGATLLDFGNMGRDCLGADVARYCLGLCLTHQITNATLLFGAEWLTGDIHVQGSWL
jgi:Ser/Thr protein kinase RdoA (MazF antagonist)